MATFKTFLNMKFFKKQFFLVIILLHSISLPPVLAQSKPGLMESNGKIYVVLGVILLIFFGLIIWLWRLDRKLTKIEHHLNNNE